MLCSVGGLHPSLTLMLGNDIHMVSCFKTGATKNKSGMAESQLLKHEITRQRLLSTLQHYVAVYERQMNSAPAGVQVYSTICVPGTKWPSIWNELRACQQHHTFLTIFCSSTRKARMMRSRTTLCDKHPP